MHVSNLISSTLDLTSFSYLSTPCRQRQEGKATAGGSELWAAAGGGWRRQRQRCFAALEGHPARSGTMLAGSRAAGGAAGDMPGGQHAAPQLRLCPSTHWRTMYSSQSSGPGPWPLGVK